jgi:hypothetical protein
LFSPTQGQNSPSLVALTVGSASKCKELDKKIGRYSQTSDRPALEGIERMIAQCLSEKIGLHATPADKMLRLSWLLGAVATLVIGYLSYALYFIFG